MKLFAKRFSVFTLVCLISTISLSGCSSSPEPHPEISAFLKKHSEFGSVAQVQDVENWAEGKRQRVISDSGRSLLFYLKNGQVQSLYDETDNGRVSVWQSSPTSPLPSSTPVSSETSTSSAQWSRKVVYLVSGTTGKADKANITYSGGILNLEPLPWTDAETITSDTTLHLKASHNSADGENFTAEIYVDGNLIAQDEGQWADVKISCNSKGCAAD